MAEAIGIVGFVSSIVQLVDFSMKVAKRLDDFASSVGEVPRAFRHIKTELPLIADILRRIDDQARSGKLESATIDAVEPVIKDCIREVGRLDAILGMAMPSVGDSTWEIRKKVFISLSKDKYVEEIAESLGRYVRVLTLHQAVEVSKGDPRPSTIKPQTFTLIPFDRNSNFVEREDLFKRIDENFNVKKGSQPKAALYGLGGIGKSQIALEYSFRRKEKDPECSVFWVHAATVARFEETYKRIATDTGCSIETQGDAQANVMQLVQYWLESRHEGRWLMVVDNIDDADVFFRHTTSSGKTLSQYIPCTANGSLLFTTRSREIAIDLTLPAMPIAVPVLTISEGTSLVSSRIQEICVKEDVLELLNELEFLPLAITQAAAFMSKRRKTISQYLDLYRKSDLTKVRMLSYEFSDHGRQYNSMESVAKTWIISFESIRKGNPRAADLLLLMSCFDRHAIPLELLFNDNEDLFEFEDAVAVLCAFSLIESDEMGTSFDMHSLVQLATKLWLVDEKKGEEDQWAFKALKSLCQKFPTPEDYYDKAYWKLCTALLPHAQLILGHAFKSQREDIELARATLLLSVARHDLWRGALVESERKNEESFNIRQKFLGEKHPDTLRSQGLFTWILPKVGKEQKAVEIGRRCLELRREVLGEDHPETLDCLSDLAAALQQMGELDTAEIMQRQAFEASKRVLGAEHLDTLNCLAHLALVLDELGRYEEAEVASREEIHLRSKVLGDENPTLFASLHNLASLLSNQGKATEAEQVYRRVLALKETVYGKDHFETITTLAGLILLLDEEEELEAIDELRAWFQKEPKVVLQNGYLTSSSIRILKRFSFYETGSISESEDSGSENSSWEIDSEDGADEGRKDAEVEHGKDVEVEPEKDVEIKPEEDVDVKTGKDVEVEDRKEQNSEHN